MNRIKARHGQEAKTVSSSIANYVSNERGNHNRNPDIMNNHFRLKWKIAASLGFICLFTLSVAQAQTNIAVGVPTGSLRYDTYSGAGYEFYASDSSITNRPVVNALGYWDQNGTGLLASHQVSLYHYNGDNYTLLVTATVPAGDQAPLINGYRWVTIPSVSLTDSSQGGGYYCILATYQSDAWANGIGGSPVMNTYFGTVSGKGLIGGGGPVTVSPQNIDGDSTLADAYAGANLGYFNPPLPSLDLPVLVTNIQPTGASGTVGDSAVFTAAFSNSPPVNLQWQFFANGVTNNINTGVVTVTNNGIVSTTLTVTNLQAANSGSYRIEAVNATDSSSYIYSDPASLTVAALIDWVQTGTFTDDSVLALAGDPANEVYGVDFGGSDAETTDNGYNFDDYTVNGDMSLASTGSATYNNYLGGPDATTGDLPLDFMLNSGIYNSGGPAIAGTLNNLMVGQTYNVIALLADTRTNSGPQDAGVGVYGYDGVLQGPRQPFVFRAGVPAAGGYILGTFTAVSTNQPLTLVTEFTGPGNFGYYGNSQNQAILLVKSTPPTVAPIYLAQDTQETPPTSIENGTVAFSAAFRNIPALNLQWQVITNGMTNNINVGVVNVTNNNISVITSTLTLSNLQLSADGNSYRLMAVNTTNSAQVVYSTALPLTVAPTISWIANGTFTDNSVLALAGAVSNEVYGVDFGGSGAQTTANGYTFGDYQTTGNFSIANSPGLYGGYMTGGATTGDAALDTLLTDGAYGGGNLTGILNNLTVGQTYTVLALLDDTRGSAAGFSANGFAVTDGLTTSSYQPYEFADGVPYVGGYILGTFTATATTQSYTIENNPGTATQYNAILLEKGAAVVMPTPPTLHTPRVSGGYLILTGTGGTPNAGYTWLQTTNLSVPITWTTNSTGTLDGSGAFSNSIPINPAVPDSYFRLRMP
jgi:Immunoglobulin I-set domain